MQEKKNPVDLSFLRLASQSNHSDLDDDISSLKALTEDLQFRTMRQAATIRHPGTPTQDDLLTQYFIRHAEMGAATAPANKPLSTKERPSLQELAEIDTARWRTISTAANNAEPAMSSNRREPAEEMKARLEREVKRKVAGLGGLPQPELDKISASLSQLLDTLKQKQVRREAERRTNKEKTRSRSDTRMSFELVVNLNTQRTAKAFFTRRGKDVSPIEPRPVVRCLEYGFAPESERKLRTRNNGIKFKRFVPLPKARLGPGPVAHAKKTLRFTNVQMREGGASTIRRVVVLRPEEEEEQSIRGLSDFISDINWGMTFYQQAMQETVVRSDTSEGSRMSDMDLQYIVDGDRAGPPVEPTSDEMREDLANPKTKAEKRRMKRNMRRQTTERQELLGTFANFNDGVDYLEFPRQGRGKAVVIAADDDDPEHGTTDYYGTIQKRRATSSKFHPRWIVLKGFDLYWYRTSDSKGQKGVIKLSTKAPSETFVNGLVSSAKVRNGRNAST